MRCGPFFQCHKLFHHAVALLVFQCSKSFCQVIAFPVRGTPPENSFPTKGRPTINTWGWSGSSRSSHPQLLLAQRSAKTEPESKLGSEPKRELGLGGSLSLSGSLRLKWKSETRQEPRNAVRAWELEAG